MPVRALAAWTSVLAAVLWAAFCAAAFCAAAFRAAAFWAAAFWAAAFWAERVAELVLLAVTFAELAEAVL